MDFRKKEMRSLRSVKQEEPPPSSSPVQTYVPLSQNSSRILHLSSDWRIQIKNCLNSPKEIAFFSGKSPESLEQVCSQYPARIPNYYLSLIRKDADGKPDVNDPIYKQCIPDELELSDTFGYDDPLHEEPEKQLRGNLPSGITHRYPDRALFLVSNQCAMYCRFCTRKRKVGDPDRERSDLDIKLGIQYLKEHSEIRDVILSGGDPLMLSNHRLDQILGEISPIMRSRKGIIRIGTRVPCVLPQRITPDLCEILSKYHPIYVNTHFNHPYELTPESEKACGLLANAGIPLGCQTVLLKGVNDNPAVMKELMHGLVAMRVRPYYIYQCDPIRGANHFRTRVEKGLEIYQSLRGHTSGLCVPHFVIDAPGGGGKIPVMPEYVQSIDGDKVVLKNYLGNTHEYPQIRVDEVK